MCMTIQSDILANFKAQWKMHIQHIYQQTSTRHLSGKKSSPHFNTVVTYSGIAFAKKIRWKIGKDSVLYSKIPCEGMASR